MPIRPGTSPASNYGINVVLNYTKAYTCFGVKCAVAPDIPNNYGSLQPITFSAPEGCILNVQRPFAVAARHIIGHLLPNIPIRNSEASTPDKNVSKAHVMCVCARMYCKLMALNFQ